MNETARIYHSKGTFLVTLGIIAVVLSFLAPRAAVNVDEQLHYPHAKRVVNWYLTGGGDPLCLDTPITNLKYYGQSVDNLTALINHLFGIEKEFVVRHYTGAFFFWLLLLFTGLLSKKISGSWLVASLTILAMIFFPRLSGQAFGNLKDIPFAAGYMAGLLMIIQFLIEFPNPRWKTTMLLGLTIAFLVSVRAGGFILFGYLGLGILLLFLLKPFYLSYIVSTKPVFVRLLGQGVVILFTGYFAGLLFWPFALQDVFANPIESLRVMEHYKVSIRQIFEGQLWWSTNLPWYYLPKWLAISTPVILLTGFLIFSGYFIRDILRKNHLTETFFFQSSVLFAFIFPALYVIAIGANLYSGVRQMLFILPPMILLAVWALCRAINRVYKENKPAGIIAAVLVLALFAGPVRHQIQTFPVDYVYFNSLAGGNKKAWGNYEYDYYFHSMKEPAEYLIEMTGDREITVAMNCNLWNYFTSHPNIEYRYTRFLERSSRDWDYGLFGVNYIHPHLLKNDLWKPAGTVQTFYHKGNPVAVLIERKDKTGFYGISEIKKGNLRKGITLLQKAVEREPADVWLWAQLAKATWADGDIAGFKQAVEKGKNIHPFYEPFFLLEANFLYKNGEYRKALRKLETLLKINPRYLPAKQLFEELKQKMN